jgi:predicted phage terminase large subunit-like protein
MADNSMLSKKYKLILEEKRYNAAKTSLYYFYKYAWESLDPAKFQDNWHLGLICEHLQAQFEGVKELQKMIISIQPRVSKSLIVSVCYPVWQWLQKPQTSIICVSHTIDLAAMLAMKSRDLILSPWFSYFLEQGIFAFKDDQNQKTQYQNNQYGARLSVSPHKAIHGFGADVILIDDPNSTEDLYSVARQDSVKNFYKGSLRNRCNNPSETLWVLVQQRLGLKDLTQFVLDEEDDWFHLVIPSEYRKHYTFKSPIGLDDPRKEGELLWPERFPQKVYALEKKDTFFWSSIYQQSPIDLKGQIIQKNDLSYSTHMPQLREYNQFIVSADLALDSKSQSDYTAFIAIGRKIINNQPKFYIHDLMRGKFAFPDMVTEFKKFCDRFSVLGDFPKLIEKKGAGQPFIDTMRKLEMVNLLGIDPVKNKEERLRGIQLLFSKKLVVFPESDVNSNYKDLIDELLAFPTGRYDDYVDALSQGLSWLFLDKGGRSLRVYLPDTKSNSSIAKSGSLWDNDDKPFKRISAKETRRYFEI